MSEKVIYEKKYPCLDWIDETEPFQELEFLDIPIPSPEEIYEKLMSKGDYIPLAKRIKGSEFFIRTAIMVSKWYEFDITITRSKNQITAKYLLPPLAKSSPRTSTKRICIYDRDILRTPVKGLHPPPRLPSFPPGNEGRTASWGA